MYINKPIQKHKLIQAITRINHIFHDKPADLIVNYINIAQSLKSTLAQYSTHDQETTGVNKAQTMAVLLKKYKIIHNIYHNFNYTTALNNTPQKHLTIITKTIKWILNKQQQ